MASPKKGNDVVHEEQITNISWYNDEIPGGTAKNNFDRILLLRKKFCHPLTINKDGTLNKKYFSNVAKETAMNWNDIELLQLYQGIYKHGIDSIEKWHKIQSEFLPQRDFIEVRIKISQLFGIQNLSKYKGRSFSSEKEIQDEFEKNKREAIENGVWSEKCKVALKPEIASLTKKDKKELTQKEYEDWKQHIYDNPNYVYRVNNKRTANTSNNSKNHNKKKKVKKSQKNTVKQMFKKQAEKANAEMAEKKEVEDKENNDNSNNKNKNIQNNKNNKNEPIDLVDEKDVDSNQDSDVQIIEKPQQKKQQNVVAKPNKKPQVVMPEDSDDEEMLCVE